LVAPDYGQLRVLLLCQKPITQSVVQFDKLRVRGIDKAPPFDIILKHTARLLSRKEAGLRLCVYVVKQWYKRTRGLQKFGNANDTVCAATILQCC
ncbi:hypothetical protein GGI22_006545, partial [Coemansia erecta]